MDDAPNPVELIFAEALRLPDPGGLGAFLAKACGDDLRLRARVEALLAAHRDAGNFMVSPAGETADRRPATIHEPPQFDPDSNAVATHHNSELSEKPGSIIGRYKLLQQIGEGGFGVVYMAEQEKPVKRRVALKVIKTGMDTRAVIARFEAERQALAMMDHPNIARVLDAGATDTGRPYFVMELVKGIPITDYCDQASLGTNQRLELFIDVCRAVQHAHQKGIIHRDLKPTNIMITLHDAKPVVKVIDFGIAKATDQKLTEMTLFTNYGQMIGTPVYMSPEQAVMSGLDVDTWSDVYSLGVLLYELLAGSPPFDAQTLRQAGFDEMRRIIREESPQKPSTRLSTLAQDIKLSVAAQRQVSPAVLSRQLHGDLDWIVLKAIEKDRARRYESASAFAQDIERHLNSEAVSAGAPGAAYKLRKFAQRNKGPMAVAAVIALLLLAGTAVSSWQAFRATRAEQRARGSEATAQTEAVRANSQKRVAEDALIETEKAEKEATQQRIRADREAESAQDNLYCAQMHLGQQAWREPEGLRNMRALLAKWLPADKSLDRRGWEWFYLNSLPYQNLLTLTESENGGKASTVAWHAASNRLAEGTLDGLIRIWDVDREQITLVLKGPRPWVPYFGSTWLAWSPDGSRLAAGFVDGTVHIWATSGGREIKVFHENASAITSVCFSSDGKRVAAFAEDGGIKIWDVNTGQLTAEVAHPGDVTTAAWSPDDKFLATGHRDGTVTFSSATAGATVVTIPAHPDAIHRVAWSPDSTRLATGFFVSIWDVASGKRVLGPLRHSHEITAIAWEPDGHRLATGSIDETAKIWNAVTGQEIATLRGNVQIVTSLSWGPDGCLASGAADGSVRIWKSTGDQEAGILPGDLRMTAVSWSPDGNRLASAGDDGKIRIWNSATREVTVTLQGHDTSQIYPQFGLIRSLAWRPDGKYLASAGLDNTAKVWDIATGREVYALPADHGLVWTVAWSPDGVHLAAGSQDGTIRVVEGLEQIPQIRAFQAHQGIRPSERRTGVRTLAWNPKGDRLASGGFDGLVKTWDPVLGTELATMPGQHRWVMTVTWSPDGKRLASAGGDSLVTVWDPQTTQPLATLTGHSDWVDAVAWSPDGNRLASAGLDNSVRIWDPQTGEETFVLRGTAGFFHDVSWNPDGARLAAACSDGHIWIWDATHGFERDTTARGMPYVDRLLANGDVRNLDRLWIAETYVLAGKSREGLALVRDNPLGLSKLARLLYERGDAPAADAACAMAIALLQQQPTTASGNEEAPSEIAGFLISRGRTAEAVTFLAQSSVKNPEDISLALEVAVLQSWFGKNTEYASTCQRALTWAATTTSAEVARRVARIACLLPDSDAPQRQVAALTLARKAVELGNGATGTDMTLEQLCLGIADYRCRQYAAADQALAKAIASADAASGKNATIVIQQTAGFYRAMSLMQQGKPAEARAFFTAAAAKMKPLPTDESNPLANNADLGDVIVWLAFKEAKALLAEPGTGGK